MPLLYDGWDRHTKRISSVHTIKRSLCDRVSLSVCLDWSEKFLRKNFISQKIVKKIAITQLRKSDTQTSKYKSKSGQCFKYLLPSASRPCGSLMTMQGHSCLLYTSDAADEERLV